MAKDETVAGAVVAKPAAEKAAEKAADKVVRLTLFQRMPYDVAFVHGEYTVVPDRGLEVPASVADEIVKAAVGAGVHIVREDV